MTTVTTDEPYQGHGFFEQTDKGLVNSIVAHLSPTSGHSAALAEMQRRQMEATRAFNASADRWVRESAEQTTEVVRLTKQMNGLTIAMLVLAVLQFLGALLQVAVAKQWL